MKNSSFKLLAVATALLFFSVVSAVIFFYAQEMKGASLLGQLRSIRDQQRLEKAHSDLETEWLATADDRKRVEKMVLDGEKDTINFLSQIDNLAAISRVVISTELKSNKTNEKGFDELIGTLSLVGNDQAILYVIKQIENLPYDLRISSLRLSRGGSDGSAEVVFTVGIKE